MTTHRVTAHVCDDCFRAVSAKTSLVRIIAHTDRRTWGACPHVRPTGKTTDPLQIDLTSPSPDETCLDCKRVECVCGLGYDYVSPDATARGEVGAGG